MQHWFCVDAVDRTLWNPWIWSAFFWDQCFFGGDFHWTLPVILKGSHEHIFSAPIHHSSFWPRVHHLKANMQSYHTPESEFFACWLLQAGMNTQSVMFHRIVADDIVKSLTQFTLTLQFKTILISTSWIEQFSAVKMMLSTKKALIISLDRILQSKVLIVHQIQVRVLIIQICTQLNS